MNIKLNRLTHTYNSRHLQAHTVLTIDEWAVDSGAHVLLRGISGSGKTTLLNVLAGLLPPEAGTVCLDSQDLYTLPEAQRDRFRAQNIGYIFQIHLLVPTLSARENVEMPLAFGGTHSPSARRRQAQEMLAQVGLGDYAHHRPVQLSVGQRLRVAVARALVNQPRLLLADEPTAALDTANATAVMDLIQQTCAEQAATLIVASHDPTLAPRFHNVLDLQAGRLIDITA